MIKYNLNNYIIIYPTEKGWKKIFEITKSIYNLEDSECEIWINKRKENGGFKEQMWCFFSEYHEMIYNGNNNYFESSIIDLCGEIIH